MDHFAIIVIGASMGGLEALQTLAAGLSRDFPGCWRAALHPTREQEPLLADYICCVLRLGLDLN